MQNENYQNATANGFSSNPENNDPKATNGVIRDERYWNELHSFCDSVRGEIDNQEYFETSTQDEIAQQREEYISVHPQAEL